MLKPKSVIKKFNLKAFLSALAILFIFAVQGAQAKVYKANSCYASNGGGHEKGGGGGCNGGGHDKGGGGGCNGGGHH